LGGNDQFLPRNAQFYSKFEPRKKHVNRKHILSLLVKAGVAEKLLACKTKAVQMRLNKKALSASPLVLEIEHSQHVVADSK